jgi:hypothetical protein
MGSPDPDESEPAPDPTADPEHQPDRVPTVSCSQCDRSWTLNRELDELNAGNRALEQFGLDHYRHTGHYPDDVTPWLVECQRCVKNDRFLSERPARRWARTHARHTHHDVLIRSPEGEPQRIDPE